MKKSMYLKGAVIMILKELKLLLSDTGDIRFITKESDEIHVTDIFLNGDGLVRIEKYAGFTKK